MPFKSKLNEVTNFLLLRKPPRVLMSDSTTTLPDFCASSKRAFVVASIFVQIPSKHTCQQRHSRLPPLQISPPSVPSPEEPPPAVAGAAPAEGTSKGFPRRIACMACCLSFWSQPFMPIMLRIFLLRSRVESLTTAAISCMSVDWVPVDAAVAVEEASSSDFLGASSFVPVPLHAKHSTVTPLPRRRSAAGGPRVASRWRARARARRRTRRWRARSARGRGARRPCACGPG